MLNVRVQERESKMPWGHFKIVGVDGVTEKCSDMLWIAYRAAVRFVQHLLEDTLQDRPEWETNFTSLIGTILY